MAQYLFRQRSPCSCFTWTQRTKNLRFTCCLKARSSYASRINATPSHCQELPLSASILLRRQSPPGQQRNGSIPDTEPRWRASGTRSIGSSTRSQRIGRLSEAAPGQDMDTVRSQHTRQMSHLERILYASRAWLIILHWRAKTHVFLRKRSRKPSASPVFLRTPLEKSIGVRILPIS